MSIELFALSGLLVKHFIVDFPLQVPYHYKNKGTYGHPGGIAHAALHGLATWSVFAMLGVGKGSLLAGLVDFVLHYHIDWAKMNLNENLGWGPTTHEEFWWLLGADQFLHQATYIFLIWAFA